MAIKVIAIWLIVDVIVYFVAWFDTIYYKHNLPKVYKKILDTFTEED